MVLVGVFMGLVLFFQSLALASSHYWPEWERWHNLHRYTYGSAVVGTAWTINIVVIVLAFDKGLIPAPSVKNFAALAIVLLTGHYAVGGAVTTAVYRLVDPWLKERSRTRRQTFLMNEREKATRESR